jgi:hypothetical protein
MINSRLPSSHSPSDSRRSGKVTLGAAELALGIRLSIVRNGTLPVRAKARSSLTNSCGSAPAGEPCPGPSDPVRAGPRCPPLLRLQPAPKRRAPVEKPCIPGGVGAGRMERRRRAGSYVVQLARGAPGQIVNAGLIAPSSPAPAVRPTPPSLRSAQQRE